MMVCIIRTVAHRLAQSGRYDSACGNIACILFVWQHFAHSSRCLVLPDGEALALDAWAHVAMETGDVRHLSPSTVTGAAIVHVRADGVALVDNMLKVKRQIYWIENVTFDGLKTPPLTLWGPDSH